MLVFDPGRRLVLEKIAHVLVREGIALRLVALVVRAFVRRADGQLRAFELRRREAVLQDAARFFFLSAFMRSLFSRTLRMAARYSEMVL